MISKGITWLVVNEIKHNPNLKDFWQSLYDSLEENADEKKSQANYNYHYYPEQLARQWSQQQNISLLHARLQVALFLADKAEEANNVQRAKTIRERVELEKAFYQAIERL